MPPIFLHMAMARDIEAELDSPAIESHQGAYYLGATSPDIRVLTRGDRAETHFYRLDVYEHQDSVAELFRQHPELSRPENLSGETAAFVAGYLTHLSLDERYIEDVYRVYFGQQSALGGDLTANTMDRLLQFELDRQRREDSSAAAGIRDALEGCSLAIDVGFLDSETLGKWLQVAIDQTRHPPDWRRFRYQGGRHLPGVSLESDEELDAFLERVPVLLQETIDHVSTQQVDGYLERATATAVEHVRRYLGEV
jgi:hypothetical protein